MATVLYARVSTVEQTIEHQRAQAEAAGYCFDTCLADHGTSGVSTRLADRPQGRRLFDILRAGDTLVVRWIDRLGRNYTDVSDSIREFMRRGVTIKTVINGMIFDGSAADPMQLAVRDALIGFMAAMAQAQAEATKEAQRAGIAHARARDTKIYKGRKPSFTAAQFETVCEMLAHGASVALIAKTTSLSRQTIYRIKADPTGQQAALQIWAPKGPQASRLPTEL